MKKGTKFLLIGGFLLILLGIMIVSVGVAVCGPANVRQMIKNGDFTVELNGSEIWLFGREYHYGNGWEEYLFSKEVSISSNDIGDGSAAEAGNIRGIKANVGGGVLKIVESDRYDSFTLKYKTKGTPCSWKVEDGILVIDNTKGIFKKGIWHNNLHEINLYVPKGTNLETLEIDLGGGEVQLTGMKAERTAISVGAGELLLDGMISTNLNVEIGAGEIKADNAKVEHLLLDMAMGNAEYHGTIEREAQIQCSMGNVELDLIGEERDFNYRIECSAGNVEIENSEFTGLGMAKYIDNGADKEISVECSMGNVEIDF